MDVHVSDDGPALDVDLVNGAKFVFGVGRWGWQWPKPNTKFSFNILNSISR